MISKMRTLNGFSNPVSLSSLTRARMAMGIPAYRAQLPRRLFAVVLAITVFTAESACSGDSTQSTGVLTSVRLKT